MKERIQHLMRGKFSEDLFWNALSFGFIALIGIIINAVIINYYDSSALGIFNQVYAIYILLSQLAVGGVHLSVQLYIAKHASVKEHCRQILSAAIFLSGLISLFFIALAYALKDFPGIILQSKEVSFAYTLAVWGLLFFSMNKILLSFHNGMREMKKFAFFQLLRFILMLAVLILLIVRNSSPVYLSLILPVSEFLLFVVLIMENSNHISLKPGWRFIQWMKIHFRFGRKALIGNFLLDVNTRVDIFILGIFLSDRMVGIYSFGATIAEGFLQLPTIFRNNINPVITAASNRGKDFLQLVIRKNIIVFYKILSPLALISVACFPLLTMILAVKEEPMTMWIIYSILIGTVTLTSGYLPFQMIFNQLGYPMLHSKYIFLIFLCNVIFNLLLIPYFGIYGAAMGTALASIAQAVVMKRLILKQLNIKI